MSDETTCWWCKAPAGDPQYWLNFAKRPVPLCEECYVMGRTLVTNAPKIVESLRELGIHIGVPKRRV